jgi:antitoxin ParD1/3/4
MSNLTRRTVTLGKSQSDYIDAKIASGEFVSASEVVRAGIAALTELDALVERWLKTEVAATFDRSVSDPNDVFDLDEAFSIIRQNEYQSAAA